MRSLDALADADDLHRQAELRLDREHDAALGGAVELGEHDAGHVDRVGELLGLHEPVLPGRRVDHEQHFLARARGAVDDPAQLLQLLHQVRLRVQAAGGVDEHEVGAAARRGGHRVEHDRAGIGAVLAAHELAAGALGPQPELVGGRGAERVGRGEHDARARRRTCCDASLPIVVVFPTPLTPTNIQTFGSPGDDVQRAARASASRSATTSSRTSATSPSASATSSALARARTASRMRCVVASPTSASSIASSRSSQVVVVDLAAAQAGEHARERGARAAEPVAQPRLLDDLDELLELVGRRRLGVERRRRPRAAARAASRARRRSRRPTARSRVGGGARCVGARPAHRRPRPRDRAGDASTQRRPRRRRARATTTTTTMHDDHAAEASQRPARRRLGYASSNSRSRMRWLTTRLEPPGGIDTP